MASSDSKLEGARSHIEEIRFEKFSIGKKLSNPLTVDLHHAVTSLSAELYTKDVHFIIHQRRSLYNGAHSEDNEYEENVEATLEFILTQEDITKSGAPTTLLIFNNENGFSKSNMESLCSVGRSTKKGKRTQGFIGEKGIGFKSVFLVSPLPHIFSNGYQVRFREKPDSDCGIGYIVPEWVSESPSVFDVQRVYGSEKTLPTTTFVLPLKPEKVEAVKAQLLALHPEILLFLSKVKRLYVREDHNDSTKDDTLSVVSISSETNHMDLSSRGADLRVVQLSVKEKSLDGEETCKYFMWKQSFPVKPENVVSSRADVKQWVITLAFPFGKRLRRGTSSVGVFAFLPTTMVTSFPFVIQADFILASSRESILFDSPWNLGILECVPKAFVNAFRASVEDGSWFSSTIQVFEFLPAQASSYSELNKLRESIRNLLRELEIVPCELFGGSRFLAKPDEVIRIIADFRDILVKFKDNGGCLRGLRTLKKVLHSSVDLKRYSAVLDFLDVKRCSDDWYTICMNSCNLVTQASLEVYIEILHFFAEQARSNPFIRFQDSPLIKYINKDGNMGLCSVSQIRKGDVKVKYASNPDIHIWLIKCNMAFGCPKSIFFLPSDVQKYLIKHPQYKSFCFWLSESLTVSSISVDWFAYELFSLIPKHGIQMIIRMAHFLYICHKKEFVNNSQIHYLCSKLPIIDGSGHVIQGRTLTLVPASKSKWAKLFGIRNPYSSKNYVDIGDIYAKGGSFLGESIPENVIIDFICKYRKAIDLPELVPPDIELQITSSQLSKEQAFMLLDWIRLLRTKGLNVPEKFMGSIQNGKWMKTCNGFKSPKQSFCPDVVGNLLYDMVKHVLMDVSVIDRDFYGERISSYQDELRFIGLAMQSKDLEKLISNRFASLASYGIRKEWVFSLLMFLGFLNQKELVDENWLNVMKKGKWLNTNRGYNAPKDCVFPQSTIEADSFSRITNIPVVDEAYYGSKLGAFLPELKLLGVITDIAGVYNLVADKASFHINLTSVTSGCGLLVLRCINYLGSTASAGLIERIKGQPWLQTTSGFKCPSESSLPNSTWGSLVRALEIPAIDELYYEDQIRHLSNELSACGVSVDTDDIIRMIVAKFKSLGLSSELAPKSALSMLECFKKMRQTLPLGCSELQWLFNKKWLKTRHGYKVPKESIIFSSKWGAIISFVDLPLIDDGFYGLDIYKYKDTLQMLGVITDFKEGADFVLQGLKCPIEPEFVTSISTIALLECIKYSTKESLDQSMPDNFLQNIAKSRFLKTTHGYVVPQECVLFDFAWKRILKRTDLPSVDLIYYEADIYSYKEQFRAIGVKVEPMEVCSLISHFLFAQSDSSVIQRLYKFLSKFGWSVDKLDEHNSKVWIPDIGGGGLGKWVNSELCVLHDKEGLFESRLYSLYNYYKSDLLPLFSSAFGVRESPSLDEYLQLWNDWGLRSDCQVSFSECYFLWEAILKNWAPQTEEALKQSLITVPATKCSGDGIHLVNKDLVFIPDDLRLKKIFSSSLSVLLFVWFPEPECLSSSSSLQKLFDMYCLLGVKKLSDSIICKVPAEMPKTLIQRNGLIKKGLIKIILAFLSGPLVKMPAKDRHEKATSLLKLAVYESDQPIKVTYCLTPSSDGSLEVETKKMVFWNKSSENLVIDRLGYSDQKGSIEFSSCFADEIAEGLLPKGEVPAVSGLRKIIHIGFVYEFKDDVVDFLLVRENLELFLADQMFLMSAFPISSQSSVSLGKRQSNKTTQLAPSTPTDMSKKQRKLSSP